MRADSNRRYQTARPRLPARPQLPRLLECPRRGAEQKRPPELLDLQPGDATEVTWTIDCEVNGSDIRGPYIQGRPGDRFIYLNWGSVDDDGRMDMFRRAKLMLADVPGDVLAKAAKSGRLVGSLGLTDAKGQPLCASVRPPMIDWSVG